MADLACLAGLVVASYADGCDGAVAFGVALVYAGLDEDQRAMLARMVREDREADDGRSGFVRDARW